MDTTQLIDSATNCANTSDRQFQGLIVTKVVIQEIPTRRYLGRGGFWTLSIENATMFDSRPAALEEAAKLKLQAFQLLLRREFKKWELSPSVNSLAA